MNVTNTNTIIENHNFITADLFTKHEGKSPSFHEFVKVCYGVWTIMVDTNDLETSGCTCPYFLENLIHKNLPKLKTRLQLTTVLPLAMHSLTARNAMLAQ